MSEKNKKKPILEAGDELVKVKEFALENFKINSISSAETIKKEDISVGGNIAEDIFSPENDLAQTLRDESSNQERDDLTKIESPVFKELSEPKLPELREENRARLQMQSPTRLNFYWSVKTNSFQTLHRVFGSRAENYRLVVKLRNQTNDREEVLPIDAQGSSWFDVDADAKYRAEIGFYAASRPFVRLMFSNTIETPRKNPSPRQASAADWSVSADDFAQVLDNSGFTQDAFEVSLAGDDFEFAETASRSAFAHFFGETENDFAANDSSEMRFALLALASGYDLENLRGQISVSLFAKLQENVENLSAEKALAALQENFGVFAGEDAEEESLTPTVFGASLINFPRASERFFKKNALPKFSPVSSFRSNVD